MSEQAWFAELYQGCYERLVLTAYAMTNDLGSAEEITQEAFALAYGRQNRVARADSPEAWLRTVVVNLARRRFRRRATLDRILRRLQAVAGSAIATADGRLIVYSTVDGPFESTDGGQTFTRSSIRLLGKVEWTRAGYLLSRPDHTYDISRDGVDWRTFTLP